MAEYIDREQVCEKCNNKNYCEKEKCPVYKVSTADVVPKSEVERLTVELEAMRTATNSYKMHYENLAREIFEEIDELLSPYGTYIKTIDLDQYAELKKKHVEGESWQVK